MQKLYSSYKKGIFLERPNRFVMNLLIEGRETPCYVPNTGSLSEYLTEGRKFYVTPVSGGKYDYKVISTEYEDSYIFLDTIMVNRIVFNLITGKKIDFLRNFSTVKREFSSGNSRFDFLVKGGGNKDKIVEVKSCSLVHSGTAMFPDAPTERGRRHLNELERLAGDGYDCYAIYLITNYRAERFIPNIHTDEEYGKIFNSLRNVKIFPLKIKFIDPVTPDYNSVETVDVAKQLSAENNIDGGGYLLVMENPENLSLTVEKLGKIHFKKGYYIYAGSARKNLLARVSRHRKKRKKIHWHIDHITSGKMKIIKVFPIRRKDPVEEEIAGDLFGICDDFTEGFGSTDSRLKSHLFYFRKNPLRKNEFFNILLDYRMFVK